MASMSSGQRLCRVAIVGEQRARVAKVVALMDGEATKVHVQQDNEPCTVHVEYLPCVAVFDSYESEQGETIRYLASVEYHGPDGKQKGSSLAPFIDTQDDEDVDDDSKFPTFPGISAVAIGCGIEAQEDVAMIEKLVKSLSGLNIDKGRSILVQCVTPNPEYASMKEENEAYRALDADTKEEVTRLKVIGPGKMVKFASGLAKTVVDLACSLKDGQPLIDTDRPEDDPSRIMPQIAVASEREEQKPHEIDPTMVRYACRKCRMILFGRDDLEVHVPSQHTFARRNAHGTARCESFFLTRGLDWMGDIGAVEGKFSCPKCDAKVGSWNWSGSQCSCGTWITPAIQLPSSRVDRVAPYEWPLPGIILGPTLHVLQQHN